MDPKAVARATDPQKPGEPAAAEDPAPAAPAAPAARPPVPEARPAGGADPDDDGRTQGESGGL